MRRITPLLALALALLLPALAACNREAAPPASTPSPAAASGDTDTHAANARDARHPTTAIDGERDDGGAPLPPSITMPPASTETPMMAEGATVTYDCDDGYLVVAYGNGRARMTLPDGSHSEAGLSVEASARSGGEVYVGSNVGLQRLGSAVEVQGADHSTRRCIESSSDA